MRISSIIVPNTSFYALKKRLYSIRALLIRRSQRIFCTTLKSFSSPWRTSENIEINHLIFKHTWIEHKTKVKISWGEFS